MNLILKVKILISFLLSLIWYYIAKDIHFLVISWILFRIGTSCCSSFSDAGVVFFNNWAPFTVDIFRFFMILLRNWFWKFSIVVPVVVVVVVVVWLISALFFDRLTSYSCLWLLAFKFVWGILNGWNLIFTNSFSLLLSCIIFSRVN